ncbi:protein transport protein Sec24B, putative [Plasmodium knowlesi strain H]|uniref:Protein transport protein Sec24B, putative n=3 Tax=Plasmodium knowlesi TaxID=5850 RepID=A0A5K1V115_PLAKH|nr:protein transport protein Sec24B, putative [Plasmodium knowlesi strain H]OTN68441.1 putative Protein transport protein Sec24B [Plasmodium knowlesi]CAA9986460.1 protein transport protein Sec24B, putative [Plasmodium knowlesi strain H]SBO24289.1 protein transport protein Sec24B, putative [Plasmodium knowlesi strain H]SBO29708.1 protein transport protein Sec24B, putative [Plasmodium knowlesi strain H]VVS75934.1 protein transport protein Sec24B, putative [Plasmodium knowlesi strain H]|eukprot:XP_002261011.1 Sec24-related protein, putative [Plasmodium knowlesi strain H]
MNNHIGGKASAEVSSGRNNTGDSGVHGRSFNPSHSSVQPRGDKINDKFKFSGEVGKSNLLVDTNENQINTRSSDNNSCKNSNMNRDTNSSSENVGNANGNNYHNRAHVGRIYSGRPCEQSNQQSNIPNGDPVNHLRSHPNLGEPRERAEDNPPHAQNNHSGSTNGNHQMMDSNKNCPVNVLYNYTTPSGQHNRNSITSDIPTDVYIDSQPNEGDVYRTNPWQSKQGNSTSSPANENNAVTVSCSNDQQRSASSAAESVYVHHVVSNIASHTPNDNIMHATNNSLNNTSDVQRNAIQVNLVRGAPNDKNSFDRLNEKTYQIYGSFHDGSPNAASAGAQFNSLGNQAGSGHINQVHQDVRGAWAGGPQSNGTYNSAAYSNVGQSNVGQSNAQYSNTPYSNPPNSNPPYNNPPNSNTPYSNPPNSNTPYSNPPNSNPPYSNLPYSNTSYSNPSYSNAPPSSATDHHSVYQTAYQHRAVNQPSGNLPTANQSSAQNFHGAHGSSVGNPFASRPFGSASYRGNAATTADPNVIEKREDHPGGVTNRQKYEQSDEESVESSSSENSSENENEVTDKGEEIYTLLKKTINRIDMNKIPRPIINYQERKKKKNLKVFETCKYISPPSYYQPYISIDTGKADPRFLKSTLYQIPLFSETLKLSQIPFGIIVNPFACLNEGEKIDKVDMKDIINDKEENIEILRCPKCLGYLHATILEDISSTVQCVFCDTNFLVNENVLFDIYQYNEKIGHKESNQNEYGNSLSPLLKGSVDIMIPPIYYHNVNNFKLTYTYLNKNINQTASMITNKIMSLTKHISSSLVANDSRGGNKATTASAFGDSGDANFLAGGGYTNYGGAGGYNTYDNHDVVNNRVGTNTTNHLYGKDQDVQNFDNVTDNTNFTIHDMKNLLCEKNGEPDSAKIRRNSFLAKYPQVKNMLPPYFVFVVECSYNAIYNNITYTILEGIRYAVQNVKCPQTKIAIITFNSSIYFYHCKRGKEEGDGSGKSGNHQVIVMSDVDDPFLPLPLEDLFFGCVEEIDKINTLIDTIKSVSTTMQSYGSCGNSALKIAMEMLKERNGVGSICMFYTTTPNCGLGAIKELKKDLQENFMEVKQKIFYDSLLLDLYAFNISVDIFIISSNNVRVCVPSLQYVAQNTGGKILFVENFLWQKDYKEIYMNIMDTLTSEDIGYCCELKLRYSHHMSVKKLFCCNNNFNSIISVDTIKIPKIRHDQTFAFLLNYSDISESKKQIYFQCACMYTNVWGDRFVRLHTTHMNLTSSLSTVFRYTDAEALMNILIKQLCTNILHNDNYSKIIIDNLAAILFSYRINCASSAHSGQLILPDTLKLLPLFTSSLLKHNVTKKEILHDLKVYSLIKLLSMPIISSLLYVYPVMYVIHIKGKTNEIDSMDVDDDLFIPKTIPSSAEKIYSNGIYLLDACTHFYLYFGFHSDANFAKEIVGDTPTEKNAHELNLTDTPSGQKVQRIIKNLSRIHHFNKYVPLVMVAPKSNLEEHLISLCVEDKADKEYSYVNFLCFIHKLVHKRIDES